MIAIQVLHGSREQERAKRDIDRHMGVIFKSNCNVINALGLVCCMQDWGWEWDLNANLIIIR